MKKRILLLAFALAFAAVADETRPFWYNDDASVTNRIPPVASVVANDAGAVDARNVAEEIVAAIFRFSSYPVTGFLLLFK